LIYDEHHGANHRFIVISRRGATIGVDKTTQGKIIENSGIRKVAEKTRNFDVRKERKISEEERQEFKADQVSSSKTRPEIREYGMH
jgi:hypothetical protein